MQNENVPAMVLIFDISGKQIFETQLFDLQNELNLSDLKTGIYILEVLSQGKIEKTIKIIKQ